MESKRKVNTMGLKVQFIPATNTKENRFKITQLNNNKSVVISGNMNLQILDFIELVLNSINEIENFSLVVDNTQNKYYLLSVDFIGFSFVDIVDNFKKY